jgi:hypothetical protein
MLIEPVVFSGQQGVDGRLCDLVQFYGSAILAEENRKGFPVSIDELCALWQLSGERQTRR